MYLGKIKFAYLIGDYANGKDSGIIDLVLVGEINKSILLDLTNKTATTSGTVAFTSFDNATFTNASVTVRGALVYNTTTSGTSDTTNAVCVLDFSADKTTTTADFIVGFPTADSTTAIIRID